MDTVRVSAKYQVVIPRAVRDRLRIRPGQRMQVIPHGGRIELIPVRPARELRGFLSHLDNTFEREKADRIG